MENAPFSKLISGKHLASQKTETLSLTGFFTHDLPYSKKSCVAVWCWELGSICCFLEKLKKRKQ